MNRMVRIGAAAAVMGLLVTASASGASASYVDSGQDCFAEYYVSDVGCDSAGVTLLGHRCAKARVYYTNSTAYRTVSSYKIYYSVTPGMKYGVANNENYYKFTTGWRTGADNWRSPDNGAVGQWISRSPGKSTSYIGQTKISWEAVPDVPSQSDPELHISTATW